MDWEHPVLVCNQCGIELNYELIATFAKGDSVGLPACYEVEPHSCEFEEEGE